MDGSHEPLVGVTSTSLVPLSVPPGLFELWLASHGANTRRVYAIAVRDFASYVYQDADGRRDRARRNAQGYVDAALGRLLAGRGTANALALMWRTDLQKRKMANNTINRSLSALRSLVTHARTLALVEWALEVPSLVRILYRDTRGPGSSAVKRMLVAVEQGPSAARDRALLWCLYGMALRCSEVAQLDLADVDLEGKILHVIGKGDDGQKSPVPMPVVLVAALRQWIEVRGACAGPLFLNCDRGRKTPTRLSRWGIAAVVRIAGNAAGVRCRPHGLRHTAITEALIATKGDLTKVAAFSRHSDFRTLKIYDDRRRAAGAEVAELVTRVVRPMRRLRWGRIQDPSQP